MSIIIIMATEPHTSHERMATEPPTSREDGHWTTYVTRGWSLNHLLHTRGWSVSYQTHRPSRSLRSRVCCKFLSCRRLCRPCPGPTRRTGRPTQWPGPLRALGSTSTRPSHRALRSPTRGAAEQGACGNGTSERPSLLASWHRSSMRLCSTGLQWGWHLRLMRLCGNRVTVRVTPGSDEAVQ